MITDLPIDQSQHRKSNSNNRNEENRHFLGKVDLSKFLASPTASEDNSSMTTQIKTPTTPTTQKHNYENPDIYYVCRDFFATNTDQISVFLDDELDIIEELAGGTWTLVRERESQQTGLIPTEILESGAERLAQENKISNQDLLRLLSCSFSQSNPQQAAKSKTSSDRVVSFEEKPPNVWSYEADGELDSFQFPYLVAEALPESLEATLFDAAVAASTEESEVNIRINEQLDAPVSSDSDGILNRLNPFKKRTKKDLTERERDAADLRESLQSFEKYSDHLIRVYTGNFESVQQAFKTFIVDEEVTYREFSDIVIESFGLTNDEWVYEVNLVNHITAEVLPIDLEFNIERVIEFVKKEAVNYIPHMPKALRKAQKNALKRITSSSTSTTTATSSRDKASDYVTPFKFVLNRLHREGVNAPVWLHIHLEVSQSISNSTANLIISSLRNEVAEEGAQQNQGESSTGSKFGSLMRRILNKSKDQNQKKKKKGSASEDKALMKRIETSTEESIDQLIEGFLDSLQIPRNLPGITFEAYLPAIHDALELPLPTTMTVGDALKIRSRIDQSQQVILLRPIVATTILN